MLQNQLCVAHLNFTGEYRLFHLNANGMAPKNCHLFSVSNIMSTLHIVDVSFDLQQRQFAQMTMHKTTVKPFINVEKPVLFYKPKISSTVQQCILELVTVIMEHLG